MESIHESYTFESDCLSPRLFVRPCLHSSACAQAASWFAKRVSASIRAIATSRREHLRRIAKQ